MAVERTSISGASVLVTCEGQDVGWATGLDGESQIEVREVRTLGDIDAKELKIVRRSVTFSLRAIRIPRLGAAVLGLVPDGTSIEMVRMKPLTFNIIDEDTGAVIKRIYGAKPTSLRFQVNEGELMQENCSWRAIRITDGDK